MQGMKGLGFAVFEKPDSQGKCGIFVRDIAQGGAAQEVCVETSMQPSCYPLELLGTNIQIINVHECSGESELFLLRGC